ncbi:hypothetical protein EMIHUDRAFT_96988 [Emiliania huxleyi CCMP1516]|uniref:Uncharacterized protein n=2 Tax=Emiliania huxleyi TaxID=2903 RepID=A0A0D3I7A8_EMIH1|nr:hypothetical protein EMIHUDRAFT_96988 [Emiliania huxleyi CCMP1516]EOD07143.1 hypothetical protein EMIHUDRAFT_96988 [Emiliania huxleyi CCMP1516]|eukprot:XP_005759572.1 hypothetical protein EMIHUDRAFT_96988 [Emiliania huxleyi CCMP1516]
MLASLVAIGSLAAFAPTALTPPSSCRQPGLRLSAPVLSGALATGAAIGLCAARAADGARLASRAAHADEAAFRRYGASLHGMSAAVLYAGWRGGALPFADAFTAAALIYGGNGLQWLLLPRYSASLYRFEAEIGPAATAAVRACGGTLLASGAYMQLLRRRGHAAGLAASAGLAAALSLARAVGALRAARAAAARQGCGLDYAPSIGRAAAAAAASAVIALGATR